jgi:hypothetical protein
MGAFAGRAEDCGISDWRISSRISWRMWSGPPSFGYRDRAIAAPPESKLPTAVRAKAGQREASINAGQGASLMRPQTGISVHKSKIIPGFGLLIGLVVWIFTHAPQSTQQILAYIGVASVVAALVWGMWKFRAQPERKSEPSDR